MRLDTREGLWIKPEIENAKIKCLKLVNFGHISFDTLKYLPECPSSTQHHVVRPVKKVSQQNLQ
jgi:hypothetical protein